jgi:acetyl-CoA carboxylase carboxyltransferase component
MSGASAAKTLLQIRVSTLKAQEKTISKEEEELLLKEITDKYNEQLSPYYAASRLWVDGVIDPMETRKVISMGIEAANHARIEKFNVGVIQT